VGVLSTFSPSKSDPSPRVVSLARCIELQRNPEAISVLVGGWYAASRGGVAKRVCAAYAGVVERSVHRKAARVSASMQAW